MVESNYHISDIYQGGYSAFNEPSNRNYSPVFTGYNMPMVESVQPTINGYEASMGTRLGISTDPRTANILKEVSEKIAPGQKVMELSLIDIGEATASIPKQHLDEVRRLSKLTGVEITVHGPITDVSGVVGGEGGFAFNEDRRKQVERKLFQAIDRAHQINPDGNIPVTFHTSNQLPGASLEKTKEGEKIIAMPIVNQETGQGAQVKSDIVYQPIMHDEKGKMIPLSAGKEYDVYEKLEMRNHTEWDNSLSQIEFNREHAKRIIHDINPVFIGKYIEYERDRHEGKTPNFSREEYEKIERIHFAKEYIKQAELQMNSAFEMAYKFGTDQEKKVLEELAKRYRENLGFGENGKVDVEKYYNPVNQSEAIGGMTNVLGRLRPQIYVPVEEYALKRTSESYGNLALEAYKKYGYKKEKDTTPMVLIENPPAGGGLSRAKDLKDVIQGARKEFEKRAVQELGMSQSDAEKHAEKMIGATWDVGHINQLRKYGFEGKDIIEEAGTIAPFVKHVHLSDNFGLDNVELPMGMGNVDFKEVMQKLGKQGEEARKIIEAAHWWQFQQTSPVGVSMEALGSPLYSMKQAPYWNQIQGVNGGYFGGYGNFLPQINYETFGGGFSNLPTELGGQRGGAGRSRMGGTPME